MIFLNKGEFWVIILAFLLAILYLDLKKTTRGCVQFLVIISFPLVNYCPTDIHPSFTDLYVISRHIQIHEIQIFVCRFSVLFLLKWKKKWNSVCRDLLNVSYKICSCGGVCMSTFFILKWSSWQSSIRFVP